jgi:hypothetical protein
MMNWKDLVGSYYGPIDVLASTYLEGLKKITESLIHGSQCPGLNSNRAPPEYEFRALPLHVVQTGPGAHPPFYPMGTGGFFPGGRAAGT